MLRISHLQPRFWDDRPKTIRCTRQHTPVNTDEHLRTRIAVRRPLNAFPHVRRIRRSTPRALSDRIRVQKQFIFCELEVPRFFTLFTFHALTFHLQPKDCPSYPTKPILSP